jgi:hypothetical protein
MFHFFRSLGYKIVNEGKGKSYLKYAIGEIFLVVVGILIALQINTWNDVRKENIEERKLLNQLEDEYLYNKEELNRNIQKIDALISVSDSLLRLFNDTSKKIDEEMADRLLKKMGRYSSFDPSNGALDNLIGSGKLKLLKNENLRIKLSKWYGELEDVKEDEVRLMKFGDEYLNPIRLKIVNFSPSSKFNRNQDDYFKDPEFENIIFYIQKTAKYIRDTNYSMLGREIDGILEEIKK